MLSRADSRAIEKPWKAARDGDGDIRSTDRIPYKPRESFALNKTINGPG